MHRITHLYKIPKTTGAILFVSYVTLLNLNELGNTNNTIKQIGIIWMLCMFLYIIIALVLLAITVAHLYSQGEEIQTLSKLRSSYFPTNKRVFPQRLEMKYPTLTLAQKDMMVNESHYAVHVEDEYGEYDELLYGFRSNSIFSLTSSNNKSAYFDTWSIYSIKLDAKSYHMFFRSKKLEAKLKKSQFTKGQIYELEGDFQNYFDFYQLKGKHIDNLSVITPDTMQAIIKAQDYHIEIDEDRLNLYSDWSGDPVFKYQDMRYKAYAIAKEINENIANDPKHIKESFVKGLHLKTKSHWYTHAVNAVLVIAYLATINIIALGSDNAPTLYESLVTNAIILVAIGIYIFYFYRLNSK